MTKDIEQNKEASVIEDKSEVVASQVKVTAKQRIHNSLDKVRSTFRGFFVADGTDNEAVRLRHLRVAYGMGLALFVILVACVYVSIFIDEGGSSLHLNGWVMIDARLQSDGHKQRNCQHPDPIDGPKDKQRFIESCCEERFSHF